MTRLLIALLLPLAACTAEPTPVPAAPEAPEAEACGAAALQHLTGQPRSVLAGMALPEPNRVIGPDTVVTMDYVPTRLNIEYDESGTITRVFCG